MASPLALLSDSISLSSNYHQFSSSVSDRESDDGSGSDTTPSSFDCVDEPSTFDGPRPSTFICVKSAAMSSAEWLSRVFDQHVVNGLLGLCVGSAAPEMQWATVEDSFKYLISEGNTEVPLSTDETTQVHAGHLLAFSLAGLRSIISFASSFCIVHILERPSVVFPPLSHTPSYRPSSSGSHSNWILTEPKTTICNIPTFDEWKTVWKAWDLVTLQMIPQEMLLQKPIDLRHKCLFYIGHIPTFLDMLLSKSIGGEPTEPKFFWDIFERGIDPHVDDPDHCHKHSIVPEADEDWPTLETILGFRNGVRARVAQLYDDLNTGKRVLTRNIARTLVMTLEHEGWHLETLLYMLIQRASTGTLPPPGFTAPPWSALASQWDSVPAPSTPTVTLGPADLTIGHVDSEADDFNAQEMYNVYDHEYGWDNESPARVVHVGKFKAEWRPVSNGEFEAYWKASSGKVPMPRSWVQTEDGEVKVRTMYGPVPMFVARHWPVLTAYDDLCVYARSRGGRLPTEAELRLFLNEYAVGYEGGGPSGFRNWHPTAATTGSDANQGRGSNGGVWEWTSTLFDGHEGLVPTNLFTGYSTDFFDTKHQVVLGSSYATIPRLERRTARNFYQHNYPYAWVGARVVYDID